MTPTHWVRGFAGPRFFRWTTIPRPSSSTIVESEGPSPAWEIILHGYFWPSQDRKSIPGVTDKNGDATGVRDMRSRWNRTLCEDLLLPLVPRALANAVVGVDERSAQGLLDAVVCSDILADRMPFVIRRHWLLPVVATDGVRWRVTPADSCPVLSIPDWSQAPEAVRTRFLASCREYTGHVLFIDDAAPRLAGKLAKWTVDHFECLLKSIPVDAFASKQSLQWIEEVVSHVLGSDARSEHVLAAAFVRWLAGQIGEGALAPTIRRSASRETQGELREAWRGLCAAIPRAWLVETPVGTLGAVVKLAVGGGVIGEGLFLLPVGRDPGDSRPTLSRDKEPLDRALTALGQALEAGGESEQLRNSRLLLAETLLTIRPASSVVPPQSELPFLRAISLPADKEEAWRIVDLRRQIENQRVFASPASKYPQYNSTSRTRPETTPGPKRAVMDLAMALGETVWWVDGDAVASVATDVPSPEPETLAGAVLQAKAFAERARRARLLRRLALNITEDANVRLAARVLLAGRAVDVVGRRTKLFQVSDEHQRALLILLRLLDRSWCAVDKRLAGSLTQDTLEALSVGQADLEALHRLLDECLGRPVDWTMLPDEEALHLLRHLYSAKPEAQRCWRRMPLHRDIDGMRGAFDNRSLRSTGRTSEFVLPRELRAGVRILDPDPEVSSLYEAVPALDRDGILQLMLEDSRPWRFAERIVQHLRSDDGPGSLSANRDLRRLLRASCWLPDRDGRGIAPDAVLICPEQVLNSIVDLARYGAFGDKRLPDSIDPQIWQTAEPVVREILGRMSRARQVERMVDALDSGRVARVDGGAWLIISNPGLADDSLIACALKTTLVVSHPGWKLVHTVDHILRHGDSQSRDNPKPLLKLAEIALCACPQGTPDQNADTPSRQQATKGLSRSAHVRETLALFHRERRLF